MTTPRQPVNDTAITTAPSSTISVGPSGAAGLCGERLYFLLGFQGRPLVSFTRCCTFFSLDWKAIYHQHFFSSSKSMTCRLSPKFIVPLIHSLGSFILPLYILLFFNHCCGSSLGTLHFLFRSLLNGKKQDLWYSRSC